MSCSNPLRLYKKDLKPSKIKNHSDFEVSALRNSMNTQTYKEVPCRYCTNCRIDRQNEIIDRAEYEFIQYGVGAFVTFTYDDPHLFQNSFIDSHTGNTLATINNKDKKKFLDNLNKLVHKENEYLKKIGVSNLLCRPDYKYICTSEYGDKFSRPHFHILFFGLDFAYCERLFWRAWKFKGSIEVGPIKNGGIAYATKYISSQGYGITDFYKYNYHHLTKPSSSHSLNFGNGLYESQLKQIKEDKGFYTWHNKKRPLPTYYKNKYKITSDLDPIYKEKVFKAQLKNINDSEQLNIKTYQDYKIFIRNKNNIRQRNIENTMRQHGKIVFNQEQLENDIYDFKHRLEPTNDNIILTVIKPNGEQEYMYNKKKLSIPLKTRDLMILKTDRKHLIQQFGTKKADYLLYGDSVPF